MLFVVIVIYLSSFFRSKNFFGAKIFVWGEKGFPTEFSVGNSDGNSFSLQNARKPQTQTDGIFDGVIPLKIPSEAVGQNSAMR